MISQEEKKKEKLADNRLTGELLELIGLRKDSYFFYCSFFSLFLLVNYHPSTVVIYLVLSHDKLMLDTYESYGQWSLNII